MIDSEVKFGRKAMPINNSDAVCDHELIAGCDFGAPRSAGQQAKKIIYIEARRIAARHYVVSHEGRNQRLFTDWSAGGTWQSRRRGWTVDELRLSLSSGQRPAVLAFDFPFSIAQGLLESDEFAAAVGQDKFCTRDKFVKYVSSKLDSSFENNKASACIRGLDSFSAWRSQSFWALRSTDRVANAQPPLKHIYQNLFSMTLLGNSMLAELETAGFGLNLDGHPFQSGLPEIIETYPRLVAKSVGVSDSYKRTTRHSMGLILRFLAERSISIQWSERVVNFCENYRSAENDPDGMDALFCLVTAIAHREGCSRPMYANEISNVEEGVIFAPV